MDDRLVKVGEFENYIEAELARQRLTDYGIKAVVTGDNASNIYGGALAAMRPAVEVFESQADEARRILDEQQEEKEF
jgi:hypothetical protein